MRILNEANTFAHKDFTFYNSKNIFRFYLLLNFHGGVHKNIMAKFKCLECKKEFEAESSSSRRCPYCMSRYLELVSGEIPRGKSWSAKSYSAR